jgi:hypothetical protein
VVAGGGTVRGGARGGEGRLESEVADHWPDFWT